MSDDVMTTYIFDQIPKISKHGANGTDCTCEHGPHTPGYKAGQSLTPICPDHLSCQSGSFFPFLNHTRDTGFSSNPCVSIQRPHVLLPSLFLGFFI